MNASISFAEYVVADYIEQAKKASAILENATSETKIKKNRARLNEANEKIAKFRPGLEANIAKRDALKAELKSL